MNSNRTADLRRLSLYHTSTQSESLCIWVDLKFFKEMDSKCHNFASKQTIQLCQVRDSEFGIGLQVRF